MSEPKRPKIERTMAYRREFGDSTDIKRHISGFADRRGLTIVGWRTARWGPAHVIVFSLAKPVHREDNDNE
jgi:hypothetical protein